MKFFCLIGIHRWTHFGSSMGATMTPCGVETCSRCGIGRMRDILATWWWTAAEMEEMRTRKGDAS